MIASINVVLSATVAPLSRGLRQASAEIHRFNRDASNAMLALPAKQLHEAEAAARGIRNAMLLVSAGFVASSAAAIDFERVMRNVNSIARESERSFDVMGRNVIAMTRELPQSATELGEGLYEIVSSGFRGAEALDILHASGRAASAGLANVELTTRAIVGVMNAYGEEVGNAAYVSDVLFKTVDVGIVRFEELTRHMASFIGITSQAGIPIEDVGAAFATITRAGIPAAQAATALGRAVLDFVRPSEDLVAFTRQLGYEAPIAMLQSEGLAETFRILQRETGGSAVAMARLFRDMRGLRAALALTSQEGDLMNRTFDEFGTKAEIAGATLRALHEQEKSTAYQLEILKNAAVEAAIVFGETMLPVIRGTAGGLTDFTQLIARTPGPMRALILTVAGATTAVTLFATTVILIAPRVAAARIAIDTLATSMPRLAAATNMATGALGRLASAMGAIGILATTAALLEGIGDKVDKLAGNAPKLDEFGLALAKAGSDAKLTADEFDRLAELGKFGDVTKNNVSTFMNLFGAQDEADEMRNKLEALDATLMKLAQGGSAQQAADYLKLVAQYMTEAQGFTYEPEDAEAFLDFLPRYASTVTNLKSEVITAGHAVDSFGVDLTESGDAAERAQEDLKAYEERMRNLGKAIGTFIGATAAIESVRKRQRAAREEAERGVDPVLERQAAELDLENAIISGERAVIDLADAQRELNELRNPANTMRMVEAELALRRAQLAVPRAQYDLINAQDKLNRLRASGANPHYIAEAELELQEAELRVDEATHNVTTSTDDLAIARREGEAYARLIREAELRVREAQLQVAQSTQDITRAERELMTARAEADAAARGRSLSDELDVVHLRDYVAELETQTGELAVWEQNLIKLAGRQVPMEVLEQLYNLGAEGATIVAELAAANDRDLQKWVTVMADNARFGGEEFRRELMVKMALAQAQARLGAAATVRDIMTEMNKIVPGLGAMEEEVKRAAQNLGYSIGVGVADGISKGAFERLASNPLAGILLGGQGGQSTAISYEEWLRQMFGLGPAPAQNNLGAPIPVTGPPPPIGPVAPPTTSIPTDPLTGLPTYIAPPPPKPYDPGRPAIRYALGGITRTPTVLYGERQTGGEAFIPLGAHNRSRSVGIWNEVGRILGMADGGVLPPGLSASGARRGGVTVVQVPVPERIVSQTVIGAVKVLQDMDEVERWGRRKARTDRLGRSYG